MTDDQKRLITRAKQAVKWLSGFAEEAHAAGLNVLSREFNHLAQELEPRIELQERALQPDSWGAERKP